VTLEVALAHRFPGFHLEAAFSAPPGITALFGRSGAGKTSIVKAVAGLLRPDLGRIVADGAVLTDTKAGIRLPPHRRRIGYVFQDARLFPHLTVRQNLRYGAFFAPRGLSGPAPEDIADLLGIGALLDRRPGALSGGETARVGLARAILSRPRLLLLDEPLASLDDARKAEILPYLEALRDRTGLPMLYVSHAMAEVARLATTIVLLEAGRVVVSGPAAEILSDPALAPGIGLREVGALLEATVLAEDDGDGLSRLATAAGDVLLPRVAAGQGARLRLRLLAQDVMIATGPVAGLSALNALPAVIEEVRTGEGPGALVRLRAGEAAILARVTQRSVRALDLRPGRAVTAVLKAMSVAPGNIGG
jgi:molybdate transport system ATP-binding protein